MRKTIKKLLEATLRFFAVRILQKYQPKIIGITGSVGKSSTTQAIAAVLATTYAVRQSFKNYNNEIGIPLTVIGKMSAGRSFFGWLGIFFSAVGLLLSRDEQYPQVLVLEMGADKPGDLEYLTQFIPLDVAVVTRVAPAHIEFFESLQHIAREKSTLVRSLAKTGVAVLNADDPNVAEMQTKTKARVVTYGLLSGCDVRGSDLSVGQSAQQPAMISGLHFKVAYAGSKVPFLLPQLLGEHMVYTALAATAVGVELGLNLLEVSEALQKFSSPPGRMKLIAGIKHTLIIDDSYNSSPYALAEALHQLGQLRITPGAKKYVVLGDMLELGGMSEQAHHEAGEAVVRNGVDVLVTVGELSRDIARGALAQKMNESACFHFSTSQEAGRFVQDRLAQGDIVLVKGSQGMRMERVVRELMAEPMRAKELLCRQGPEWKA